MTTELTAGRAPLSLQQHFLALFDKGDDIGIFGPRYHDVAGWRIRGAIDLDALQSALDDLVARHEALRTIVVRGDTERYQQIAPPSSPELRTRDLPGLGPAERERAVQDLANEIETGTFGAGAPPLLRATLVRFDETDGVLFLDAHHVAADFWSMQILIRDLAVRYASRDSGPAAPQYREYVEHQLAGAADAARTAQDYWQEQLRGAEILAIPTDASRSAGDWAESSWHRAPSDAATRALTIQFAAANRSSPFMVLLAAYQLLLHDLTGATDIVVPTFTPGRREARFENTVGSFFNLLPLRTDLSGCSSFRALVQRTRATCTGAYVHEIPLMYVLPVAPTLMNQAGRDDAALCVFQVIQPPFVLDHETIGDLEYTAAWRREVSQPVGSYVPDGMLWSLFLGPTDDDILANIAYSRGLFADDRVSGLTAAYFRLLHAVLTEPDAPLDQILTAHGTRRDLHSPHRKEAPTIERRIGEIWRQVLGRPDLTDQNTFFEAGGQSIAAVRIVAQIEDEFGLDVNMGDLFDDPDLTTFARRVAKLAQDHSDTNSKEEPCAVQPN